MREVFVNMVHLFLSAVKKGISLHESMDKAPRDKYPRNGVLNAQTDFVLAYMKGKKY